MQNIDPTQVKEKLKTSILLIINLDILKKVILTLCLIIPLFIVSQNNDQVDQQYSSWNTLLLKYQLNDKFYLFNEAHFRRTDFLSTWQQIIIRPSINYILNETVELSVGYTYSKQYKTDYDFNDDNVWEQLVLKHSSGKSSFNHRFRYEQRFIDNVIAQPLQNSYKKDGTSFAARFRYRFTWTRPLFKITETKHLGIHAFDEIWLHTNKGIVPRSLNQNWFYVGFTYPIIPNGTIELGYMDAFAPVGADHYNNNTILQTTFKYIIK